MIRAVCISVFATLFSFTLVASASASLIGQSVEACVWTYADCVAVFTPGSNASGSLIPASGQAVIVDPGVEFDYFTNSGNGETTADFGENTLDLTLDNLNLIFTANLAGGMFGWVFEFENPVITDVTLIGGSAVVEDYSFDADTITVLFGANSIPSLGSKSVSFAVGTVTPEPTTALLLAGGLVIMSAGRRGRRSSVSA